METALILIVGNNISRAIKAIEEISPDIVYFIRTEKYRNYEVEILKQSDSIFEKRTKLINNFQSIDDTYNISKQIFDELDDENYEIIIALSNGTKAMVSGLVLASVAYDCELIYVGSDSEGRDEDGDLIDGHEVLLSNFNPLKKQAILEISKAKQFFNKYQFDEAIKNFELAKKVLDNEDLVDIYINIANLYKYWDKFDVKVTYRPHPKKSERTTKLNVFLSHHILKRIEDDPIIKNYFLNKEKLFYDQLKSNEIFLNNKIYEAKKPFIDKNNILYYLVDLMNNAARRIEEKKFDDATARLYRASELIAQIRLLTEFKLIDENKLKDNSVFHIVKSRLIDLKNLDAIIYGSNIPDFRDPEKKVIKLALHQDYCLLYFLGDELAKEFLGDKRVQGLLATRNNSILAHGLNPAIEKDAVDFLKGLEKYAKQTSILKYDDSEFDAFLKEIGEPEDSEDLDIGLDAFDGSEAFDKYYEYSKFPKFKDIEL